MIPTRTKELMAIAGVPWWERALWQVAYFAIMSVFLVWTLGVLTLIAAGWALSRLLPPSWRPVWRDPPVPEPPPSADCPACRSPLMVEPPVGGVQIGTCPNCCRAAMRKCRHMTFGSVWFAWEFADAAPRTSNSPKTHQDEETR